MPTRKKGSIRNTSRELASPKALRSQKKNENIQVAEKKVSQLITSSARKQKCAGAVSKKSREVVATENLSTEYRGMHDEISNPCLDYGATSGAAVNPQGCEDGTVDCVLGTIFSPTFHQSTIGGGELGSGGTLNSCFNVDSEGANLSSEVSAIYLAMKNSKLECIDEPGQDSVTAVYVEDDDYEEYDDFDPYLFIKNLPDLSSVVPTFRPVLLPKQTRSCPPTTLVLDLDETLVHSTLEPCDDVDFTFPVNFNCQEHTVYVRCRPFLRDFMERVAGLFEIIIFTASQSIYAEQLLNVLDPKRRVFRHRVFRESCVFVEGNYLKDLSVLGRDLAHVIIIDNSPQAFGFQVDNGIPIESWFDDRSDQELLLLLPFLESLVRVEDVRPIIAEKFNVREKIAAAAFPINSNRREDFLEG